MGDHLRVEFHCHTNHSPDSLSSVADLLQICRQRGIDRLVLTDHNTITGALAAKALDPERVIIGEEIMTQEGELLAAYVQEEVPKGLPAVQAINLLRAQGAFISVSHPFDVTRSGHWQERDLLDILPLIDAIEIFNARCFPPAFNRKADWFAQTHDIHGTAGSDAHAVFEVGKATMLLPAFEDAESFRKSLPEAKFAVSYFPPWVRLTSRYAVLRKKLTPKRQ